MGDQSSYAPVDVVLLPVVFVPDWIVENDVYYLLLASTVCMLLLLLLLCCPCSSSPSSRYCCSPATNT